MLLGMPLLNCHIETQQTSELSANASIETTVILGKSAFNVITDG